MKQEKRDMNGVQEEDKDLTEKLKRVFNFHPLDTFESAKDVMLEGLRRYPRDRHAAFKVLCLDIILSVPTDEQEKRG